MDNESDRVTGLADWLGLRGAPRWSVARPLGIILSICILLLFTLAVAAAFGVLIKLLRSGAEASLGTGALVAALLGAPFVIWGTALKHQTVTFQKEGHMTDRISKAVEQLGTEKSIKTHLINSAGKKVFYKGEDGMPDFSRPAILEETAPNLEVRIGAIMSLERIAQDSTRHDNGRDHVGVMEILCAYIRENSNATTPKDHGLEEWQPLGKDAGDQEQADHERKRTERFGAFNSEISVWAKGLTKPRTDITFALKVLGRRTVAQRKVEAAWPNPPTEQTIWPFDLPRPVLRRNEVGEKYTHTELVTFSNLLYNWENTLRAYAGYRLDLRGSNLQGAEMGATRRDSSDSVYSGVLLDKARMEGANLRRARLEEARLEGTRLEGANLEGARLILAWLSSVRMDGAILDRAVAHGAHIWETKLTGASIRNAELEGSYFSFTEMAATDLSKSQLTKASFWGVQFAGANLELARMEEVGIAESFLGSDTRVINANLSGAYLKDVDISAVPISQAQIDSAFGDSSVILPDDIVPPAHWPNRDLGAECGGKSYSSHWRAWRESPGKYAQE